MCLSPSFILRPALLSDAEGIACVHVESWQVAYADLMPSEAIASRSLGLRTQQWRQWIEEHSVESLFVVEQEGKILGFVSGGPTRGQWAEQYPGEIYALYIHPTAFGQGLGSCLFKQMKTHLKAQGYASQWVWVLTSNTKARRFYEKRGGIYQTTSIIEIGSPPLHFEEVAYGFNDKVKTAITPLRSSEK